MLTLTDPNEAYRRTHFDARIQGSDAAALVHLCLEQAMAGLGGALLGHQRSDPAARSKGLTRALTAITALEMGVDRSAPLAASLLQIYGGARKAVLDSVTNFDPAALETVRQDFTEIDAGLRAARQAA